MVKDQNGNTIAENVDTNEWIKAHADETIIHHFQAINEVIVYR